MHFIKSVLYVLDRFSFLGAYVLCYTVADVKFDVFIHKAINSIMHVHCAPLCLSGGTPASLCETSALSVSNH